FTAQLSHQDSARASSPRRSGRPSREVLPASRISCFFILLYSVGTFRPRISGFFILLYSAGVYRPRICAASCLFQLVRCSVCRIAIFSISARVRCGGGTKAVSLGGSFPIAFRRT